MCAALRKFEYYQWYVANAVEDIHNNTAVSSVTLSVVIQGFAAHYIKEYVDGSGCTDDLNVGELWVDLAWGDNGRWCGIDIHHKMDVNQLSMLCLQLVNTVHVLCRPGADQLTIQLAAATVVSVCCVQVLTN